MAEFRTKPFVIVVAPRLDLTFKEGPLFPQPIPPIREHWKNFIQHLMNAHGVKGDAVGRVDIPLWTLNDKLLEDPIFKEIRDSIGIVYLPHRESHQIVIPGVENRYYMQSVFPWRFYIDSKGFAGGASFYPLNPDDGDETSDAFDKLREYAMAGGTKFEQPETSETMKLMLNSELANYVLFPCQLPHDVTIKHHSDVTVEQALEETCRVCEKLGINLIVKGHPVNPGSMAPLEIISNKYKTSKWVSDVNIHDLIRNARAVVVVNSGTGMESLLHSKPVITFGRCEYDAVTYHANLSGNLESILSDGPKVDMVRVKKLFDKWCKLTYDTSTEEKFFQSFFRNLGGTT